MKKLLLHNLLGFALLLSLLNPRAVMASATAFAEGAEAVTPFQTALQEALQARTVAGLAVAESVSFESQVVDDALALDGATRQLKITSQTVIAFAAPEQAGYSVWPAVVVPADLPEGAQGEVRAGDYDDLIYKTLAEQRPGIWDTYQFGHEPRTYVFEETYIVAYAKDEAPELLEALTTGTLDATTFQAVLVGFTYPGPNIDYTLGFHWEVLGVTVAEGRAGFALDWALGLRLPLRVSVAAPEVLYPNTTYTFSTALTPLDWSAADYLQAGVAGENGNEFILRFNFFLGARLSLFGARVLDWALSANLNQSKSFTTPFGPGSTFPLPGFDLPPEKTGLNYNLAVLALGIGLKLQPTLTSNRITASWQAVAGSDASGSGSLEYTAPDAAIALGPVQAGDYGPTKLARVEIRDFKYWFNSFHVLIDGYVRVDVFGYGMQSGDFDIADLDLSGLTGGLWLGTHAGTRSTVERAVRVAVPALDVTMTPTHQSVGRGNPANFAIALNNTGEQDLVDVSVANDHCALVFVSGDGDFDGMLDIGETWQYSCAIPAVLADTHTTVSALAMAAVSHQWVSNSAEVWVDVPDGMVGDGTPATCTEEALETELNAGSLIVFNCGPDPILIPIHKPKVVHLPTVLEGGTLGRVTLSGEGATRVLDVVEGVTLTLNHLMIANGSAHGTSIPEGGGGVRNRGELHIESCRFAGNSADYGGGLHNGASGTLFITATTFSRNWAIGGGAIYNDGWMQVSESKLGGLSVADGNLAQSGGGLVNWDGGTAYLLDTHIQNNQAVNGGGAVQNGRTGSGPTSILTLLNSTIADNTAGGYGGGLVNYLGGYLLIENSVVASNVVSITGAYDLPGGGGLYNFEYGVVEIRASQFLNNSTSGVTGNWAGGGGLRNQANGVVTILNSTFGNNYGDYGGGIHNAGALNLADGTRLVGNYGRRGGGGLYNEGTASIHNSFIGGDTPADGNLTGGVGPGWVDLGSSGGGGLVNWESGSVTLMDSVVANNLSGSGGGIQNGAHGVITVAHTQLYSNTATVRGGALVNYPGGQVTVSDNSAIIGNRLVLTGTVADLGGGAMFNSADALLTLRDTLLQANSAHGPEGMPVGGGALRNMAGGTLHLDNVSLQANEAEAGGAIHNAGQLTISHSQFNANRATLLDGGALVNDGDGQVQIVDSVFTANQARGGGAILGWGNGTIVIERSLFQANRAGNGGALENGNHSTLSILNSTLATNTADHWGGGLFNLEAGTVLLQFSTLAENAALAGGGINHIGTGSVNIANSLIAYNTTGENCAGGVVDGGHNLQFPGGSCGVTIPTRDPYLKPLADNGGPTLTYALLFNSPAIDAAEGAACPSTDQRGATRPMDGNGDKVARCDLGAFELNTVPLDGFNRANGKLRDATHPWYGPEGLGGYQIISRQVDVLGGGPIYWNGPTLMTSQEAYVTLVQVDANGGEQSLLLKVQGGATPNWRRGLIEVIYDARIRSVRVATYRPNSGRWTIYPAIPIGFVNGDQLGGQVLADGTVRVLKNGIVVATITLKSGDQSFFNPRGGKIGLWFLDAGNAVLDDFGGGSVGP